MCCFVVFRRENDISVFETCTLSVMLYVHCVLCVYKMPMLINWSKRTALPQGSERYSFVINFVFCRVRAVFWRKQIVLHLCLGSYSILFSQSLRLCDKLIFYASNPRGLWETLRLSSPPSRCLTLSLSHPLTVSPSRCLTLLLSCCLIVSPCMTSPIKSFLGAPILSALLFMDMEQKCLIFCRSFFSS